MLPTTLELIKKSFSLYKNNKLLFFKFAVVFFIPLILTSVSQYFFLIPLSQNPTRSLKIIASLVMIILDLITLFGSITFIRVIYNKYVGNPVDSLTKELRLSLPLLLSTLWIVIIFKILNIVGFFLFIIPAFLFSIWFLFSIHARVIDQKKGFSAFLWSKHLVRGYAWDIIFIIIAMSLLLLGGLSLFQTVIRFVSTLLSQAISSGILFNVIGSTILWIVNFLMVPFFIFILPTILYAELKKLKQS